MYLANMTIRQILDLGIFQYKGNSFELVSDVIGWTLFKNGAVYRKYAARVGAAEDIRLDIEGITQR